jgi:hypothetical protein
MAATFLTIARPQGRASFTPLHPQLSPESSYMQGEEKNNVFTQTRDKVALPLYYLLYINISPNHPPFLILSPLTQTPTLTSKRKTINLFNNCFVSLFI